MGALPDDWTLPQPDEMTRAWFTSGELAVQTCSACQVKQHPPEEICHRCGSMSFTSTVLEPAGTIYSYTIAHYPVHPALADVVPYAVVLVALDEDPTIRVVGNLVGLPPELVEIGMAVSAVWERHEIDGEVIHLPQWTSR